MKIKNENKNILSLLFTFNCFTTVPEVKAVSSGKSKDSYGSMLELSLFVVINVANP